MKFDKLKVYTALNADELKVGSTVVVANDLSSLKTKVEFGSYSVTLLKIWGTSSANRFEVTSMIDGIDNRYCLCYLVSEPKEKKLRWTELKVGDVIRHKDNGREYMVVGLDKRNTSNHIRTIDGWLTDIYLERSWGKVEE